VNRSKYETGQATPVRQFVLQKNVLIAWGAIVAEREVNNLLQKFSLSRFVEHCGLARESI
jgi:hypothetical protein